MANVYMRIDGLNDIKGAATVEDIGGKKGWMVIESAQVGMGRPIYVKVGSSSAAEVGTGSFSDISISRMCDGASPYLQTFFFAPGDTGKTVEIVIAKAARTGEGLIPSMVITMEEARLSSYSLVGAESASESIAIAYTKLSIAHYTEDASGTIAKSDTVAFDLRTAKLVSKASL